MKSGDRTLDSSLDDEERVAGHARDIAVSVSVSEPRL
jgi:hypothetical protein